jgi:hypothetical protein
MTSSCPTAACDRQLPSGLHGAGHGGMDSGARGGWKLRGLGAEKLSSGIARLGRHPPPPPSKTDGTVHVYEAHTIRAHWLAHRGQAVVGHAGTIEEAANNNKSPLLWSGFHAGRAECIRTPAETNLGEGVLHQASPRPLRCVAIPRKQRSKADMIRKCAGYGTAAVEAPSVPRSLEHTPAESSSSVPVLRFQALADDGTAPVPPLAPSALTVASFRFLLTVDMACPAEA